MASRGPRLLLLFLVAAIATALLLSRLLGKDGTSSLPVVDARDAGSPTPGVVVDPAPPRVVVDAGAVLAVAPRSDGGALVQGRAKGTVVVHGGWGSGPGQFGRKRDPESNPEAPMAMVAGAGGEVAIVDQVNRRVQRFADGKLVSTLSIGGDTVQDVAFGESGRTVLLDRLADRNVQVYDRDGKLINEVKLEGQGVPEGGGVTGVFSDDKGIYVEREHSVLVRIADPSGNGLGERAELPGRPSRDGRLYLAAAMVDRAGGTLRVRAFTRDGKASPAPAWEQVVSVGSPILNLLMLDSDRHGMVYVAAVTGHESPEPPFQIVDEAITVVRLGPGGTPRGALQLPSWPSADETFRTLSVDDDGNVFAMEPGSGGLNVVRYSF